MSVWYEWCGVAENGTALVWCRVEEQIVVNKVQFPKVADSFQIHHIALTLGRHDRRAP